jgi:hypothetical protein
MSLGKAGGESLSQLARAAGRCLELLYPGENSSPTGRTAMLSLSTSKICLPSAVPGFPHADSVAREWRRPHHRCRWPLLAVAEQGKIDLGWVSVLGDQMFQPNREIESDAY